MGAAINPRDLEEGSDRYKIIDKQFNVFTLENGTKAENIHPQEDVYDFEATDQLVEYGQANGKTVRGHTLVWYSQCPEWFFLDDQGNQVSAEVLIQRMKEHITHHRLPVQGKNPHLGRVQRGAGRQLRPAAV